MTGTHRVIIQNKRIRFEFEIQRNITIIRGDSATGKTTLVDMIQEYMNLGSASMINFSCDKKCVTIAGVTWESQLSEFDDSIVFIDEGNDFVLTDHFASVIQNTNNYYVIVSREGLPNLPYSVEEIYGIHMSGRYGELRQCYQEFYRIYNISSTSKEVAPRIVMTEDSNSGYEFFAAVCEEAHIKCISAFGKSNVIHKLSEEPKEQEVLVIVDGAAFGSEIDKVVKYIKNKKNIKLYVPESFEWIILKSGVIDDREVAEILLAPSEHIDSERYFSWERFFTQLLADKTQGSYLKYSKSKINKAYTSEKIRKEILAVMENICLESE